MEANESSFPTSTRSSNPSTATKNIGLRTFAPSDAVRGDAAFNAAYPRASYRHKEDERGLKHAVKTVTPSFSAAARDISATSKAATASPRRKILAEKNLYLAKDSSRLDFGMEATQCSHRSNEQRRALDLEIKNPQCQSDDLDPFSTSLISETRVDVDPSLSPYDPYANYLALRPRFLYYRPNLRVKRYLLDDSGLIDTDNRKRLGDIFSTESCEDILGQIESSDLPREYEEESCCSEVKFTGEYTSDSESNPESSANGRSLLLYKLACFILVLVIACFFRFWGYCLVSFSMTRTPLMTAMTDLHLRDYVAVSAVNLKEPVRRMEHWSFHLFAHYSVLSNIQREQFGPVFLVNLTASPVPQRLSIDYSSITGTILSNKEISQENVIKKPLKKDMEEEYNMERHQADVSRQELEDGIGCEAEKRSMDVIQDMEENKRVFMQATAVSEHHKYLQGGFLKCETDNKIEESGIKDMEQGRRINDTESEKNVMMDLRKRQALHDVVTECEVVVNQDDGICLHSSSQIHSSGFGDISSTSCHEDEHFSYLRSPEASDHGVNDLEQRVRIDGVSEKNVEAEHMKRQDLAHNLVTDHVTVVQDDDIYSSSQIQSSGLSNSSLASGHKHEISNNIKSQEASIYAFNALEQVERIDSIASEKNAEVEYRKRQDTPHQLATEHLVVSEDDIGSCSASQVRSSGFVDIPLASSQGHGSDAKYPLNLVKGLLSSVFLLVVCSVIVPVMWNQTPMVGKLEITPSMLITKFVSASNERYDKARKSPYQNTPVDMLVNSGPSEFSSSLSVKQHRTTKKQQEESRPRRDSALSSTSISYGCFTAYEKLSSKKGNRKEAAMMPVRRSSRIRNQITSP